MVWMVSRFSCWNSILNGQKSFNYANEKFQLSVFYANRRNDITAWESSCKIEPDVLYIWLQLVRGHLCFWKGVQKRIKKLCQREHLALLRRRYIRGIIYPKKGFKEDFRSLKERKIILQLKLLMTIGRIGEVFQTSSLFWRKPLFLR